MTLQRMEHVGIVVDDLGAAKRFFVELGLELQGEMAIEGGHGGIELIKFHAPPPAAATGTRRPTLWASAICYSSSTTSTPPSRACKPSARSSLAR